MKIIGITGRVGSGKTFATNYLKQKNDIIHIDLDELGHALHGQSDIIEELKKAFGEDIVDQEGSLNRSKLSEIVFADHSALETLNNIMHPHMLQETKNEIKSLKKQKTGKNVIISGALLKEIGCLPLCNKVVVIDAEDQDIENAVGEKFKKISPHQRTRAKYLKNADVAIQNTYNSDFEEKLEVLEQELF